MPEELNPVDPSVIQSVSGSYQSADGSFQIQISLLGNQFLEGAITEGGQSGNARIFAFNSRFLYVDDGIDPYDAIDLGVAPGAGPLTYDQYNGTDAHGNPVYKKLVLQNK
jgi:hypothetical protein